MGYRHTPLSARIGLAFDSSAAHWQVSMPDAECFMYLVAHMNRLFGKGYTLYVEGLELDAEAMALYQAHSADEALKITPVLRNPAAQRLHIALGSGLAKTMNRLASCKTYAQMGEVMLVYKGPQVWMDGSRLGERVVRLHGDLSEPQVRRFAGSFLRGTVARVTP